MGFKLTFKSRNKGFTLVELLIVISIIAILSVIGMVIYSSVQKNARDSRRRADINSMAQSAETHFNTTANQNCTNPAVSYCPLQGSWFSSGVIPSDPTPGNLYCGWQTGVGNTSSVPDPSSSNGTAGPWTTSCPGMTPPGLSGVNLTTGGIPWTFNWKFCAWLEGSSSPYCRSNQQ